MTLSGSLLACGASLALLEWIHNAKVANSQLLLEWQQSCQRWHAAFTLLGGQGLPWVGGGVIGRSRNRLSLLWTCDKLVIITCGGLVDCVTFFCVSGFLRVSGLGCYAWFFLPFLLFLINCATVRFLGPMLLINLVTSFVTIVNCTISLPSTEAASKKTKESWEKEGSSCISLESFRITGLKCVRSLDKRLNME